MGAHSGNRRWLGLWTHTGRHSDSPVLESEYPEPAEHTAEYVARHADRIYTDPVTEIQPEHRHRRSRLWGSVALATAVVCALVAAVVILSTYPGSGRDGAPAAIAPSPHDEPSESPLADPEPDTEPPAAGAPTETPQRQAPSPTGSQSAPQTPAGTATVTVTPSGPAPAPVRPSGPVPTVTTTRTVTQTPDAGYGPEPAPTVTVTRTVRATETRFLPRPRVTVTVTVSMPSLLP